MDQRKEILDNFLSQKKSERILIYDKNKKILNLIKPGYIKDKNDYYAYFYIDPNFFNIYQN